MRHAIVLAVVFAAPALVNSQPSFPVTEIPTKDLKITPPKGGKPTVPTEITSADALAKSPVLKDAAEVIRKKVDFATEKLVLFAWGGSGGDKLAAALTNEKDLAEFTLTRGKTRDFRLHMHLYVVPKDAEVKVLTLVAPKAPVKDKPAVRLLKGVTPVESKDFGMPKPVEIATADALAKSPAFDAAGRAAAKKQVDFATEKLVVFAWSGSGGDKLTPERIVADKKTILVFHYQAGRTDDLRRHALVYAVPKDAVVEVKK